MTELMISIYNALTAGVACSVSRSWPQRDPQLPTLSFRLKSWSHSPDGSANAVMFVQIRAPSPGYCDELFAQAETALAPLGFLLSAASDEVEEATGFFLKDLDFSITLGGDSPTTPVVAPLRLLVKPLASFVQVNGLTVLSVKPASRPLVSIASLSTSSLSFFPGPITQDLITVSGEWIPADPGQAALAAGFDGGTALTCRMERGSLNRDFLAVVRELSRLPSGFTAVLQLIQP